MKSPRHAPFNFRLGSLKLGLSAALLAASVSAFAASYYVVVPVPNRTPTAGNVMVSLTGYSLPAGQVGTAYVGFDFNSVLQVLGDPGYNPSDVHWSVAGGALPAGLSLNSNGRLTGAPTSAGTASFQVLAAYKTKAGEQSYQLFIAKLPGNGTLSVTALNFGEQPVGSQTAARTVVLTNIGGDTLGVTGVTSTGPFAVSTTCPASLAPNESCASSVTFSPAAMGPASGTVKVSTSNGERSVDLSGTGLATQLSLSPASADFGNVKTNASATRSFTLTNQGNAAASSLTYAMPADVTESDNCGQTLAAGASCTVTLNYAPTTAAPLAAPLKVSAQDSNAQVPLTGTPTCPGGTATFNYTGADQTVQALAACGHASIAMWGAGGAGYSGTGGGAGYTGGTVPLTDKASLVIKVGQGGYSVPVCEFAGYTCTTTTASLGGGGGGGSFVFVNGTLAMAAGGGGGGGGFGLASAVGTAAATGYAGGAGGGLVGAAGGGKAPSTGGGGGTQTAGGAAGICGTGSCMYGIAGSYLLGGATQDMLANQHNYGGGGIAGYGIPANGAEGGGGGGYYGGGSGDDGTGNGDGGSGGGGGSGYVMPGVTNATLTAGSGTTPGNAGSALRGSAGNGGVNGTGMSGLVSITWQQ
ncbi:choice-of-anchor D domain-containing protein [Paraburkholderia sp. A2RO-4L]|uniref:choice-of-anchor D domain-containing protein n=1 Tax=Paraburkholderia sp. A2RO-4L TaxID=3028374 RepID=UPI0032F158BD|nr:choice-of-anchor D domain-containing protein [Burkholderia vietnamiensis]